MHRLRVMKIWERKEETLEEMDPDLRAERFAKDYFEGEWLEGDGDE